MSVSLTERPEATVRRWRTGFDAELANSPAGPLFSGGRYAEAELLPSWQETHIPTGCTGSGRYECC